MKKKLKICFEVTIDTDLFESRLDDKLKDLQSFENSTKNFYALTTNYISGLLGCDEISAKSNLLCYTDKCQHVTGDSTEESEENNL